MKRFPDHARVVFIGDSITAAGMWIAHIYDHYLRSFPHSDIRMFNTGISGGSAKSALDYFDQNIMVYRPTHAVIMLGMNDVARNRYEIDQDGNHIYTKPAFWWEAMPRYKTGMRTLIERLQKHGISITLVTPTCYDESQFPRRLDKVGCDAALEYAGEINRRLSIEYGCEFVNLHAPFRLLNVAKTFIRDDRVHPLENGHIVMAQLFLHAQELADEPTLATFQNLPETLDLLPENQSRFEAEKNMRLIWNTEWHLLRGQSLNEQERHAFLQTHEAPTAYFESLRAFYLEHGSHRKELLEKEIALCDACANLTK